MPRWVESCRRHFEVGQESGRSVPARERRTSVLEDALDSAAVALITGRAVQPEDPAGNLRESVLQTTTAQQHEAPDVITTRQPTPSTAPPTPSHSTTTRYQMESIVPSWPGSDSEYQVELKQTHTNRMMIQGWTVVEGRRVEVQANESSAVAPEGMSLLTVWWAVTGFDFEVPDEQGSQPPATTSGAVQTQQEPYSEPT